VNNFKLAVYNLSIQFQFVKILIEINLKYQGINGVQLCQGPIFGDLSKTLLGDVFLKS
jgi:hypothetical protein